jgi:hypothetical protein
MGNKSHGVSHVGAPGRYEKHVRRETSPEFTCEGNKIAALGLTNSNILVFIRGSIIGHLELPRLFGWPPGERRK